MKYLILNRDGGNNFNVNISSPFVISNQSNISYNDFDWLIEIDIPSNSEILGQPVIINKVVIAFQNITVNNNSCNILLDEHNNKSFEYIFDTEGKYLLQFKCITPFKWSGAINETICQYITKIMLINNWSPFYLNAPNGTELYLNITRDFDTYEKWGPVSIKQFMPKVNKVVFHNETQKIAPESFQSCAYLTSTNLSELNKLTSIGSSAFNGTNLTSIIIPKNCTTLGGNSFAYIKSKITELNLGNIQRINGCAFTNCTFDNLDIEIPESLTYVERGIFYQSTGINSIKFKSSVPFESSAGFSNIFGDAKTIYVPKGSRINYLNSGYCASGFGGNAYDSVILNAQSSYDSYINRNPLLTYDPTFTYEDAIEYITGTNTTPGYQVSSIKNGYPAYQFWMNNYYGPVIYGLISSMNGVSVPSNDASDEDVSSYWNQIIDRFKNYQPSSYKNINDEVVGYWKDLVLNENNEIKDKYKETDRKFNVDLFNADAYEIGLSLVKPWIDHYYNSKTDLETIELYNNKIRSEAQIEYDKVFNSLSTQYGFDKVIEY